MHYKDLRNKIEAFKKWWVSFEALKKFSFFFSMNQATFYKLLTARTISFILAIMQCEMLQVK